MEEIINRSESSFEVSRNAKGQWQLSIKIYGDKLEESLAKVKTAVDDLNKKYPFI
jgi:hypothetical protein